MQFDMLPTNVNGQSKTGGSGHQAWVEGDGPVWSDLWPRRVPLVQTAARRPDWCDDAS